MTEIVIDKGYMPSKLHELKYNINTKKIVFEHSPGSKIFRRTIFTSILGENNILCEDLIFFSYVLAHNEIHFYDYYFYQYKINVPESILYKIDRGQKEDSKSKIEINNGINLSESTNIREYKIAIIFLLTTQLHVLTKEHKIKFKILFNKYSKTNLYKWYFRRNLIYKISYVILRMRLFGLFSFIKKRKSITQ